MIFRRSLTADRLLGVATTFALGALVVGSIGSVAWADHTPTCPPGSRHPGGAWEKAEKARALATKAKARALATKAEINRVAPKMRPEAAVTNTSPGPGAVYVPEAQPFGSEEVEAGRAIERLGSLIRDAEPSAPVPTGCGALPAAASPGGEGDGLAWRGQLHQERENNSDKIREVPQTFRFGATTRYAGAAGKDIWLLQRYDPSRRNTFAYWTELSNVSLTADEYKELLALLDSWGGRQLWRIARVPKEECVEYFKGVAASQMERVSNETDDPINETQWMLRHGGGTQYLFREFDRNWIVRSNQN